MTNALLYEVTFKSYNPFPVSFPNRRVISRETLHVIKALRDKGISVRVVPEGGELNYLAEKGIKKFLSDPLHATLVNVPIGVLTGIIATLITNSFSELPKATETHVVIEMANDGTKIKYDHLGQPISDEKFKAMLALMQERAKLNEGAKAIKSPYENKPVPIYFEHTPKIIGWGNVLINDTGLYVDEACIDDKVTHDLLDKGELNGFSIACLVRQSTCSICKNSYFDCNHLSGQIYDDVMCVNSINDANLIEVSVVKNPVNPHCKIFFKE